MQELVIGIWVFYAASGLLLFYLLCILIDKLYPDSGP